MPVLRNDIWHPTGSWSKSVRQGVKENTRLKLKYKFLQWQEVGRQMSKACLITWSLCKYREKVEPWGMAWLSWNQILHSFVYTFNIFLLVDILSKPSAENTKIIDLDIHCFMGETDRCVCYGGKGRVLGESLVGTARLRLGMKDDPSHWHESLGMRQRNCVPWTNKHEWLLLPLSRNEQKRRTLSFFQPATLNVSWLLVIVSLLQGGREARVV